MDFIGKWDGSGRWKSYSNQRKSKKKSSLFCQKKIQIPKTKTSKFFIKIYVILLWMLKRVEFLIFLFHISFFSKYIPIITNCYYYNGLLTPTFNKRRVGAYSRRALIRSIAVFRKINKIYLSSTQKIWAIWLVERKRINPVSHISHVKYDRVFISGVW